MFQFMQGGVGIKRKHLVIDPSQIIVMRNEVEPEGAEALRENSENHASIPTAPICRAHEKGTDAEDESELEEEEYNETVEISKDKRKELAEAEDKRARGEEEAEAESGVTSGGCSKRVAHQLLAKTRKHGIAGMPLWPKRRRSWDKEERRNGHQGRELPGASSSKGLQELGARLRG